MPGIGIGVSPLLKRGGGTDWSSYWSPLNFTITMVTPLEALLTWSNKEGTYTGIAVERSDNGGDYYEITLLAFDSVTYTDTDLVSGHTYKYRLRYYGEGDGINEAPVFISASVSDAEKNKVYILMSKVLDETSVPNTSAFTTSPAKTITNVAVSVNKVALTVDVDFEWDDVITVSFTKSETDLIKSETQGVDTESFADESVTNSIASPYGAEMIDQATWFTSAFWTAFQASWSTVGTTVVSNGNGYLYKSAFWTIGKTYHIVFTMTRTSGTLNVGSYGVSGNPEFTTAGTKTFDFTVPAGGAILSFRGISFVGSITAMSIKEVL